MSAHVRVRATEDGSILECLDTGNGSGGVILRLPLSGTESQTVTMHGIKAPDSDILTNQVDLRCAMGASLQPGPITITGASMSVVAIPATA